MILGTNTRSWAEHLYTTEMPRMVERARRRGVDHIELCQGYMGQFEEGAGDDWRPSVDKLARLVRTFPLLSFNLAIEFPYISGEPDAASPLFQSSLEAARTLGAATPRLRLVDTSEFDKPWEKVEDIAAIASGVARLAREANGLDVRLCMENSGQPLRAMSLLVEGARAALAPEEAGNLGLCVDPVSSIRSGASSDPDTEMKTLPLDYLSMVHIRQTRDGQPHPSLAEGDIDWSSLVKVLKSKGYSGLAIVEVPPVAESFELLKDSVDYLKGLMGSG